ncbi:hypothetical protein HI359_000237 [Escherichia coli]|uniref:hypothetical protein n=1 Tax=Escherichia coli TaxID=562 RepID=UPI0010AF3489|nr:hypothetical protein [Escherichia coli]EER5134377.1 hypothetical protein [Escherichia coli]EFK5018918.1 hypothetical protein [Escherichia coli]EGE6593502.1 hypothetical protein [Escherichia coli]GCJ47489.1 hypothetical protein BvCmsC61A_01162 [Escherichia coli]HBA3241793.1 hypothetical protein [Escherichia coli]
MINKAILETTTFHDLKLLSECFINLIQRAQEENDLGLLDDIIDNIATYKIPLTIAMKKAREAQQQLEQLEEVA